MSVPVDKCGFVEIWIVGQFPLQSGSSVVLKEVLTEYFGVWKHFWKRFRQDNHTTHPAGDVGRKKGKFGKVIQRLDEIRAWPLSFWNNSQWFKNRRYLNRRFWPGLDSWGNILISARPCRVTQGESEEDMKYYIVKETKYGKEYKRYKRIDGFSKKQRLMLEIF